MSIKGKIQYDKEVIKKLLLVTNNKSEVARLYCEEMNIAFTNTIRKHISTIIKEESLLDKNLDVANTSISDTKDYSDTNDKISAYVNGNVLTFEQYCDHWGFNINEISSYKSVTHNGTPYFNLVGKPIQLIEEVDIRNTIKELISELVIPHKTPKAAVSDTSNFNRVIYTDSHIGMDTGGEFALYPTLWNKETQQRDFHIIADEAIKHKTSETIYLDDLGDHMDGWSGQTTRGGHHLPQNMSNVAAFKNGIKCKLILAERLSPHFKKVIFNNICNDNHAGDFGTIVNESFKDFAELKYNNVKVINHRKFISHYGVGNRCHVISHGKDDKMLKHGFKVHIDEKQINKIDAYCKEHKLYRQYDHIEFSKGDSHQCLLDMCSSSDFDYFNIMALSPSSEWVQTNFKRGKRGFMLQDVHLSSNKVSNTPIWL